MKKKMLINRMTNQNQKNESTFDHFINQIGDGDEK